MSTGTARLRNLLDDTEAVHRKDISDFARGHLNESRLLSKEPTFAKHRHWQSAHMSQLDLKPRVTVTSPSPDKLAHKEMSNVIRQFTLGTSGRKPYKTDEKPLQITAESTTKKSLKSAISEEEGSSLYSVITDDVLIEEYMLNPFATLPPLKDGFTPKTPIRPEAPKQHHISSGFSNVSVDPEFRDILKMRHSTIVPGSLQGATKRDQYHNRQKYQHDLVRPRDAIMQNTLTGKDMVADIELQLQKNLQSLSFKHDGPTDEKLHVYKKSFGNLIDSSATFSHALSQIKDEYERYLDHLKNVLNSSSHHELVQAQVRQMTARGTSRPHEMARATRELEAAEVRAEEVLEEHHRLLEQLEQESKPTQHESLSPSLKKTPVKQKLSVADEIEHIKSLILEKMDKIEEMRHEMKNNSVPSSVCSDIENCIKETEIEIQKLLKQNEYFEQSVAENVSLLKGAILDADTSERDSRRIWRKVNSQRRLGSEKLLSDVCSEIEDEETKWAWYIS